ncbi:MAG: alpha/beta fold hydrolase [Pseudomonadota bacterium]
MLDSIIAFMNDDPSLVASVVIGSLVAIAILIWGMMWSSRSSQTEAPPPRRTRRSPKPGSKPIPPPAPAPEDYSVEEIDDVLDAEPKIAYDQHPAEASREVSVGAEKEDHYVVTVHYGTDREDAGVEKEPDERFNCNRARPAPGQPIVTYGSCDVSIPKTHKVGKLEAPSWYQSAQPSKHVLLLSLLSKDAATFFDDVKKAAGDRKQAFVFVHGFSVSFEDAARRTAQLAFDLKFDGAPIFFSWPTEVVGFTNPDPTAYSEAENNARWATQHFRTFLQDVIQKTGAETVHLIAHSMGNRVVSDALMELYWSLTDDEKACIGEVILTAPDIDADVFVDQIAPRITSMNSRVTLYASDRDRALASSKTMHGYPRIGDYGALALMHALPAKMDVVDASLVDTDSFGHSYYGNSESVISDLCHVVLTGSRAPHRTLTLDGLKTANGEDVWRAKRETQLETVWASVSKDIGKLA